MKRETNLKEEKITLEMSFEEEAAIIVAIVGEILNLKSTINSLQRTNKNGEYDETIAAANRRIETLEAIKRDF